MANNGGRTAVVEEPAERSETDSSVLLLAEEELNNVLGQHLRSLSDIVDSPRQQLILRNIILTLLELPEHEFTIEKAHALATQDQTRTEVIEKLKEGTPQYWSNDWNQLWKKDADPLLSMSQQRIASRTKLITFWSGEWATIPPEARDHVANALKGILNR
jgi:hypothetical protein